VRGAGVDEGLGEGSEEGVASGEGLSSGEGETEGDGDGESEEIWSAARATPAGAPVSDATRETNRMSMRRVTSATLSDRGKAVLLLACLVKRIDSPRQRRAHGLNAGIPIYLAFCLPGGYGSPVRRDIPNFTEKAYVFVRTAIQPPRLLPM
jgi:hypothetical protein